MEPVWFCWDVVAVSLVYLALLKNNHKRTSANTYRTFLASILFCIQIPHEFFLESVKGKEATVFELPWARKFVEEADFGYVLLVLCSFACARDGHQQYKGVGGQPCTPQGSPHLEAKAKLLEGCLSLYRGKYPASAGGITVQTCTKKKKNTTGFWSLVWSRFPP